ncbi:MAG: AI-2E family transporter [Lachnospiraceae bacterium]|nr:AI-2E family transporter [Lachnospiraceae bacterium]
MFDAPEKYRKLSHWIIGTFTCCILIYLSFRHISSIAGAISWLVTLAKPLLFGIMFALILNVPMRFIEELLQQKTTIKNGIRPLSILLALALVLGIFIGIAVLVIPELLDAVKLLIQIAVSGLDQMEQMEMTLSTTESQLGQYLAQINIDWSGLKIRLEEWAKSWSNIFVDIAVDALKVMAGEVVTLFISFVFAINILASKERLKYQVCKLIRVWLPNWLGENLIHISSVCNKTFRLFIAGQATEAVILGTLCMIGMAILRIPYAPMVGALIGVTALIPVAGAYLGAIIGAIMIMTVNPFKALVFLIFLIILQQVEGNVIYPKVVGTKINLPSIWVLAAVTIGGNLAGPVGLLLGVPAASSAYALLKEATNSRQQKISAKKN